MPHASDDDCALAVGGMLNRPEARRTACSGPALPQRAAQAGRSTRRPVPFPVVPAPVMTTAARTSGCRAILTKITRISCRCARSRTELLCIVIQGQTTDRHVASEIGESVGAVERQTGARSRSVRPHLPGPGWAGERAFSPPSRPHGHARRGDRRTALPPHRRQSRAAHRMTRARPDRREEQPHRRISLTIAPLA